MKHAKSQCNHFKKLNQHEQFGECMQKAQAESRECKSGCATRGNARSMESLVNMIPLSITYRRQIYLAFI
jgi:hypothetical protein